jgi:hypothetical protein
MTTQQVITRIAILADEAYQQLDAAARRQVCIIMREDRPLYITNQEGEIMLPLLVIQLKGDSDSIRLMQIARYWLFKYPLTSSIVVVGRNNVVEGVVKRETVAEEFDPTLVRGEQQGFLQGETQLSGPPRNVPLIIFHCPKDDYEYIPFEGEPKHLCPMHQLQLEPKRVLIDA